MSIMGEIITTSGLSEVILEDLNTPIGLSIVEKLTRIRNNVQMPFRSEVISTSSLMEGILETILEDLQTSFKTKAFWKSETSVIIIIIIFIRNTCSSRRKK